ncbi:MAG: hypothetical protein HC844_11530 [Tabrizicola sp.]|nr:hypothetical protein [Tabrizicola sp.]
MTRRYDDGAFVANEPDRRPIRDEYRDRFFTELGIERLKDPFACTMDPVAQQAFVQTLHGIALSVHDGNKAAIQALQSQIGTLGFGLPTAGLACMAPQPLDFQATTIERMFASTFHRWFGSAAYDRPDDTGN